MTAATHAPVRSTNPKSGKLRGTRIARAAVLLLIGCLIAFTATLHSNLEFDRWVLFGSLLLIGAATAVEFSVLKEAPASLLIAVRAALSFLAAAAVMAVPAASDISLVIAVWAAASAVIAVVRIFKGSQSRAVGGPSALLSALLAVLVLLFSDDLIAVIGFFGAYAIVRGVFLAISAFDAPGTAPAEAPLQGTPVAHDDPL